MTHDNARTVFSEMTDITEITLAQSVYRDTDLDVLYRACPTAFWLAPDGDGVSPPQDGPTLPRPLPVVRERSVDVVDGTGRATFAAMLAAGPTFAGVSLALSGGTPGEAWWEPFGRMAMSLVALPLTVLFGSVLGLIPIVFGTLILGEAGTHRRWLQRQDVWIGTGAVLGIVIAALFAAPGLIGVSLVVTSMVCAGIARHAVTWHDPELA